MLIPIALVFAGMAVVLLFVFVASAASAKARQPDRNTGHQPRPADGLGQEMIFPVIAAADMQDGSGHQHHHHHSGHGGDAGHHHSGDTSGFDSGAGHGHSGGDCGGGHH